MRNSKLAYLFTYNNIWKLVFISIINAVSHFNTIRTNNKHTHTQQSSFNNIYTIKAQGCIYMCIYLFRQVMTSLSHFEKPENSLNRA